MNPETQLHAAGLSLPERESPAYDYDPYKLFNGVVYLAGQLGKEEGRVVNLGKVGREIEEAEATRQMQICALQALCWLKAAAGGDLGRVAGILQLRCYVACTESFDGISRIADHASNVFVTAFGADGRHPRSVLGMMRLPQNAPVMLDLQAAIETT